MVLTLYWAQRLYSPIYHTNWIYGQVSCGQMDEQRLTPDRDGLLTTSVVIPPDSEIVAKFAASGIRPHGCALVEPARCLIEEYGVVVGHTLVDTSSGSGNVLIVNLNAEVVVLPGLTLIGKLVPVAAISVAIEDTGPPGNGPAALPEYLEEIVEGSHPSLGEPGRQLLRDLLLRYRHVFEELAEPLVALPRKGVPFLGFPTEDGRFVLDTDASLFAMGGVLSQLQKEGEVVIAYASRSLRVSQRRYCTTRREMLAAVVMCTHFRSYLRGAHFTLRTDHSSLRWLRRFRNGDGMLAHWYLLLGQFLVTFKYRPGSQHTNTDGMSRQCGQCQRPDCPVSAMDSSVSETDPEIEMVDQPFSESEIGESMDADLLPEMSAETWVASALIEESTADLLLAGCNVDLIAESRHDDTLATVRGWIQSNSTPAWADCAISGIALLGVTNRKSVHGYRWPVMGSQLVVPRKRQAMIHRFHDSLFAGHLGISRTV